MFKLISALLIASISYASAETVGLYIKSSSSVVDGLGISSIHEGAGFNYFFAGKNAEDLTYSAENKTLSLDIPASNGEFTYYFAVYESYVSLGIIGDPAEITFDSDGVLQLNGSSSGFYACMNTSDPYSYSTREYEVMYFGSGASSPECIDITLTKSVSTVVSSSTWCSSSSEVVSVPPSSSSTWCSSSSEVIPITSSTWCPSSTEVVSSVPVTSTFKAAPPVYLNSTVVTTTELSTTLATVCSKCTESSTWHPSSSAVSVSEFVNGASGNFNLAKCGLMGGFVAALALLV